MTHARTQCIIYVAQQPDENQMIGALPNFEMLMGIKMPSKCDAITLKIEKHLGVGELLV